MMGGGDGQVGKTKASYHGENSYKNVAYGGAVGDLKKSCHGYQACLYLAYDRQVRNLRLSCKEDQACYGVAFDYGSLGDITTTRIKDMARYFLAKREYVDADLTKWGVRAFLQAAGETNSATDCFAECEGVQISCTGSKWNMTGKNCTLFHGAPGKNPADKSNKCVKENLCLVVREEVAE